MSNIHKIIKKEKRELLNDLLFTFESIIEMLNVERRESLTLKNS